MAGRSPHTHLAPRTRRPLSVHQIDEGRSHGVTGVHPNHRGFAAKSWCYVAPGERSNFIILSLVMKGSPVRVRASASGEAPCKTAEFDPLPEGCRGGQDLLFGYRRGTAESRVAPLTDVSGQAVAVGHRGTGCSCCADRTTREGAARRRSFPGLKASSCDRLGQPVAVRHASPQLLRSGRRRIPLGAISSEVGTALAAANSEGPTPDDWRLKREGPGPNHGRRSVTPEVAGSSPVAPVSGFTW